MPKDVQLEDVDSDIESLRTAMDEFDSDIQASLASTHDWKSVGDSMDDIVPREEIFLISSFYLNMRQAALHICQMLEHSRDLVDRCQRRHLRRRFYSPQINWQKWLHSGGEDDQPTTEMGYLQTAIYERLNGESKDETEEAPLVADKELPDSERTMTDPESGTTHAKERGR